MAYPPRIFRENYWYHVYTRGQRQEPLYFSPTDRVAYLSFLDREFFRQDGLIGSYCLMTNHVHLLIKMQTTPLDEIFQTAHMKYAKYFNTKRGTKGHVFQGRPAMKIVLGEKYLTKLVGYIHQNPVEAGMTKSVSAYDWSSWSWFVTKSPGDELRSGVLPPGFRGGQRDEAFEEVIDQPNELPGEDPYIGTEDEWEEIDRREEGREGRKYKERRGKKSKETIASHVVEGTDYSIEDIRDSSRKRELSKVRHEVMSKLYEEGYNPTEIGKWFNRTPSAVLHAHEKWTRSQE